MAYDDASDPEHDSSNEPDDHEVNLFRSVAWFDPPGRAPVLGELRLYEPEAAEIRARLPGVFGKAWERG